MLAPNNNRGITHQTDEKHILTIFPEYFVGVVKLACYSLNTRLKNDMSLPIIFLNIYTIGQQKTRKCYAYNFVGHPGLHHTH